MSHSRNPPPRGQGAARAKQMGLLLDLSPDGGMDEGGNEKELEAELLALMGGDGSQGKRGKAPVPMADIERMAALCMKDLDDDDVGDEDLEDDDDLLTLQSMMASAKKGKPINEEEIPPPVATGGKPAPAPVQQLEPIKERGPPTPVMTPSPFTNQKHLREAPHVAPPPKPHLLVPPQKNTALKQCVLNRQREYKLAALQAKQGGESELARQHYHIAKEMQW
ncbi:unnamed protein product [Coregonus sp. 'balchen']|nr:unnamed protein product [Coregonus sp. 'balchen']